MKFSEKYKHEWMQEPTSGWNTHVRRDVQEKLLSIHPMLLNAIENADQDLKQKIDWYDQITDIGI